MRRIAITTLTAIAAFAALHPGVATSRQTQLPAATQQPAPSCPRSCLVVSRTTGFQAKIGDLRGPQVVPRDGRVVAFKLVLGKPGPRQQAFFSDTPAECRRKGLGDDSNSCLGLGKASAQITILKPGRKLRYRVVGQSSAVQLEPYFGQTVEFPLVRTLRVRKGYVVALTTRSWAPALAVAQPGTTSWRASRARGKCTDTQTQTAQTTGNQLAQYYCLYRTAQLTYSTTIISTP